MKTKTILALILVTQSGLLWSQTDKNNNTTKGTINYSLNKSVISAGGGIISGGSYQVTGVIGQIDAGHNASGGNYQFNGGFLTAVTPTNTTELIFKNGFE